MIKETKKIRARPSFFSISRALSFPGQGGMASSAGMRGCVAAGGGRRRRRQAVCAAACCVELLSCFLRRRLGFRGTGAAAPADAAQCTRQAGRRAWRQAAPRWVSERASHRRCQHTADDCAGARSTGSLNRGAAGVRGVRRDRGALTGRRCAGPMSSGGNRPVNSYKETEIIDGVTVDVKARVVTVKGKRGTLVRDFKHLNVEIYKKKNEKTGKDVIVVSFALCACWCPCLCCTCSRLSQQGAAGRSRAQQGAAGDEAQPAWQRAGVLGTRQWSGCIVEHTVWGGADAVAKGRWAIMSCVRPEKRRRRSGGRTRCHRSMPRVSTRPAKEGLEQRRRRRRRRRQQQQYERC